MSHRYTEYGVIRADGPHRGTVAHIFRSYEAAQRWIKHHPPRGQQGEYVIGAREVTITDWIGGL